MTCLGLVERLGLGNKLSIVVQVRSLCAPFYDFEELKSCEKL